MSVLVPLFDSDRMTACLDGNVTTLVARCPIVRGRPAARDMLSARDTEKLIAIIDDDEFLRNRVAVRKSDAQFTGTIRIHGVRESFVSERIGRRYTVEYRKVLLRACSRRRQISPGKRCR